MIGKLKGLVDSFGDDHVLIDCRRRVLRGLLLEPSTLQALPQVGPRRRGLHRNDRPRGHDPALRLCQRRPRRRWFNLLMTVQGVGARVALSILSALSPSELSSAIALQDKAMVGRANGVGPKLAVRLVTELKGKVPAAGGIDAGVARPAGGAGRGRGAGGNVTDAVSALTNLGYSSAQASAAVARVVGREGDGVTTDKLIRMGLRELSS